MSNELGDDDRVRSGFEGEGKNDALDVAPLELRVLLIVEMGLVVQNRNFFTVENVEAAGRL